MFELVSGTKYELNKYLIIWMIIHYTTQLMVVILSSLK